jgi:hypothetical protein
MKRKRKPYFARRGFWALCPVKQPQARTVDSMLVPERRNKNQQRRRGLSVPHGFSPRRSPYKQVTYGIAQGRLSTSLASLRFGREDGGLWRG